MVLKEGKSDELKGFMCDSSRVIYIHTYIHMYDRCLCILTVRYVIM